MPLGGWSPSRGTFVRFWARNRLIHRSSSINTQTALQVASYTDDIVKYLYERCGDYELAQDLAQDTLEIALQDEERWNKLESPKYWLLTVAGNLFKDVCKKATTLSIEQLEESGYVIVDLSPSPEERAIAADEVAALCAAVEQLSDEDRLALMCIAYDVPRKEVACRLGCSVDAVNTRIFRAKEKLRELMLAADGE